MPRSPTRKACVVGVVVLAAFYGIAVSGSKSAPQDEPRTPPVQVQPEQPVEISPETKALSQQLPPPFDTMRVEGKPVVSFKPPPNYPPLSERDHFNVMVDPWPAELRQASLATREPFTVALGNTCAQWLDFPVELHLAGPGPIGANWSNNSYFTQITWGACGRAMHRSEALDLSIRSP